MSVFHNNALIGAGGGAVAADFQIDRSLRFNSGDTAYLSRDMSTASSTYTFSTWIKRADVSGSALQYIFASGAGGVAIHTSNTFYVFDGSTAQQTTAVFRDPSAWYHLVFSVNSGSFTLYVNGVSVKTGTAASLSTTANRTSIGRYIGAGTPLYYLDAYLAEVNFIDGLALAATDFGEYDSNSVWQAKEYSGTYGTNGFRLTFSDNSSNSALGNDSSGNNNDWTVNNLTAESPATFLGASFDGNDYLSLATTSDFAFGTGDFTVEYWVNISVLPSSSAAAYVADFRGANSNNFTFGLINSGGALKTYQWANGTNTVGSTAITLRTWNHVAHVRSGSTVTTYLNGSSNGTMTNAYNQSNAGVAIGARHTGAAEFVTGHISNLRIVKGTAVYSSSFTPSTSLTNITNTVFLGCKSSSSVTTAVVTPGTITANGDPTAGTFSDSTSANDSLIDTPTNYTADSNNGGNYCTWNPFVNNGTLSNGNLDIVTPVSGVSKTHGTIAFPSSGKYYFEVTPTNNGDTGYVYIGDNTTQAANAVAYYADGRKRIDGTFSSYGASWDDNDVIGCAVNVDDGEVIFYKNGFSQGTISYTISGKTLFPAVSDGTSHSGTTFSANFGQRQFAFDPPTGFLSLVTTNLSDPTIADGSTAFDIDLYAGSGSTHERSNFSFNPDLVWIKNRSSTYEHLLFDSVRGATKYIKSNSTAVEQSNSNVLTSFDDDGFTLGNDNEINKSSETYVAWAWDASANSSKTYTVKVVSDSGNKYRFDDFGTSAVTLDLEEGSTYVFDQSDSSNSGHPLRFSTTSDGTHNSGSEYTTGVTTTGTPGSAGAKTTIVVAASAPTLYYYCSSHSGMGGQANTNSTAGASNFAGSIQSTVRANASAGFSIVKFTMGSGSYTVGHGLGAAPSLLITKSTSNTSSWWTYHESLGTGSYLALNSTAAAATDYSWGTAPTSTVFTANNNFFTNGYDYIVYCFTSVNQYSAVGSYQGNGSTDGPFVFTGFRPKWILFKGSSITGDWRLMDTSRDPYNPADSQLYPNNNDFERNNTAHEVDYLSNGFKVVTSSTAMNTSGATYVWAAFGEHPFKTARAR